MIKQLFVPLIIVAAFIVAVGIFVKKSTNFIPKTTLASITISSTSIKVEIANTPELRAKGLSGRTRLDSNSGMLFVYNPKGVTPGFWMKDMQIPLDLIWITGSKVVKIDKNIPFPSPSMADNQLQIYYPGQPIDYVLEVNAGFADTNHIQVGDTVDLSDTI